MPILPIFLVLCLFIFAIAAILMRPSTDDKAVGKRIASVKAPDGAFNPDDDNLTKYLKTLQRGSFGWMEDVIEGTRFHPKLAQLIVQADSTSPIGNILMTCLGLALTGGTIVYLIKGSLIAALVTAAAMFMLPIGILRFKRNRRVAKFNAALPDCIDLMSRSLRAGHAMNAALAIVAGEAAEPAKTEFGEVCKKQTYGLPMRDCLMQLLDRMPSQDLRVLVTGMLVQKDTGGNLVDILERILFVVRERGRIQGEIKTHTAQGRLTGYILCALPVIMLVLINLINPGYSSVLFTTPFGNKLLYVGIGLLIAGHTLIQKIINGIEV